MPPVRGLTDRFPRRYWGGDVIVPYSKPTRQSLGNVSVPCVAGNQRHRKPIHDFGRNMSLRGDQLATLKAAGKDFDYYSIANPDDIDHLPHSLEVLVENLVHNADGADITDEHTRALPD